MKVQDIMTSDVQTIGPTKTLRQAARKMSQLNIGALPVEEDGRLLGFITDRDISCFAISIGRDPNSTEVQKVMAKEVTACYEDLEIEEAAQLMEEHHIRRLPVLHRDNQLAGILTVEDLAQVSHELAGEVLEAAVPLH